MSHCNIYSSSARTGRGLHNGRYALALFVIGASVVLMVGMSLEGLWINQVAAEDGGSTIPIPPPYRPTPQATDNAPFETPTATSRPITSPTPSETPTATSRPITSPTPSETFAPASGQGISAALWFGIGLGAVSLAGLAVGIFVLVSSNRPRSDS